MAEANGEPRSPAGPRLRPAIAAYFGRVRGDDPITDPRSRRMLFGLAALFSVVFFVLSYLRYATFHNHTFDLAFYARMAWGEAHFDGYQPIVSASVWGLHLVWIFELLGPLGTLFGHVPTLLAAQALALGASGVPLARIAARRFATGTGRGEAAYLVAPLAAFVLYLHPNTAHVAAGDFHPGTVAVLPLAWLMDALDRKSPEGLVVSVLAVLSCREDLGLVTGVAALLFASRVHGTARRTALWAAAGSFGYVAFFMLVLLPAFGPSAGSLSLHFGSRGGSVVEVAASLLTDPGALVAHLATPARALLLPTLLAPLAFLPLFGVELLVAAPLLALALLSEFPTATHLDSHYLTPVLPIAIAAAFSGWERVAGRLAAIGLGRGVWSLMTPLFLATVAAQGFAGGLPLARGFDRRAFVPDANTEVLTRIVERVGPDASVQAPDAVLAHFAARVDLRRAPPPETRADFVVLDLSHRRRLLHDEDLLRTDEEPNARAWLAREDHALLEMEGDYALLARNRDPRTGLGFRELVREGGGSPDAGRALTACLRLVAAHLTRNGSAASVELELVSTGPCPPDLALRIGVGYRPRRVDLIASGRVSPAQLRAGDAIRSLHSLDTHELSVVLSRGLRVGALRASGSPPEHGDPPALDVTLSE